MPDPKHRKAFIQHLQADQKASRETVNILRSLNQSTDALEDAMHGPRTTGQRIRQFLWRELGYVGMAITKMLLILAFNFAAFFVFGWLLLRLLQWI